MNIVFLTNEYPPYTYGGAGVHVEYLVPALARLNDAHSVTVHCFGDQRQHQDNLTVQGIAPDWKPPFQDPRHRKFMDTVLRDLVMAGTVAKADIVHCHTWYTHLAGCLVKQLTGAKLVLTTHSLEPHRPWKVEQLGTAYQASSWIEKTAYQNADGVVAVSNAMKTDVQSLYGVPPDNVQVIYNGIDIEQFRPTFNEAVLTAHGIALDKPIVLFVGRITRQKGIIHLVKAIEYLRSEAQVVLCAGEPDTPEIGQEMQQRVAQVRTVSNTPVIWIDRVLPKPELITLYSHASVFVCPSVYEPFGIINLEAMACETPVVASHVGGIPEIIVPGETGLLVPFASGMHFEPLAPDQFARDLAAAVDQLLASPERLRQMGQKARQRVEQVFSWTHIAEQTLAFYQTLLSR